MGEERDLIKQPILRNCNDIAGVKYETLIIVRVATFESILYIQFEIEWMVFLIAQKYGKCVIAMVVYKRNIAAGRQAMKKKWIYVSDAKMYLFKQMAESSGTRWCQQKGGCFRRFSIRYPHHCPCVATINKPVCSYRLECACKRLLVSLLTLWIIQGVPPLSGEMLISCLAEGQMRGLMQTSDEKGVTRNKIDTRMEVLENANSKQTWITYQEKNEAVRSGNMT